MIRLNIWKKIVEKSRYSDKELILIDRGRLYLLLDDLEKQFKKEAQRELLDKIIKEIKRDSEGFYYLSLNEFKEYIEKEEP